MQKIEHSASPDTFGGTAVNINEMILYATSGKSPEEVSGLHPILAQYVQHNGLGGVEGVDHNDQLMQAVLNGWREKLISFDPGAGAQAGVFWSTHPDLPPIIKQNFESSDKSTDFISWLSAVPDRQFLNLLQWHGHSMEMLQKSPSVLRTIKQQRSEYKAAVMDAVKDGWLPVTAMSAISEVDDIKVYLGDVFSTLLEDMAGYHSQGSQYVVVAERERLSGRRNTGVMLRKTLKHEFNHAVLGELPYFWFREAVTEHIATVFNHGEQDAVDPIDRTVDTYYYHFGRILLAEVLQRGAHEVPVSMVTRAYAQRDPEAKQIATEEVFEAIDKAWSHEGVVKRLSNVIADRKKVLMTEGISELKAEMHAIERAAVEFSVAPGRLLSDKRDAA